MNRSVVMSRSVVMKGRRRVDAEKIDHGRRATLGALAVGGAAGAVALATAPRAPGSPPAAEAVGVGGPRELDLDEADLRTDPDLAG